MSSTWEKRFVTGDRCWGRMGSVQARSGARLSAPVTQIIEGMLSEGNNKQTAQPCMGIQHEFVVL